MQPVYVQASQTPIPQLHDVIIVNGSGGGVTIADNLQDALRGAVTGQVPSGPGPGGGSAQQQIQRLLAQAQIHFANAEAALKAGDLALYQTEIDAAQAAVQQVAKLAGLASPTASSSPSPSVSPNASPSP